MSDILGLDLLGPDIQFEEMKSRLAFWTKEADDRQHEADLALSMRRFWNRNVEDARESRERTPDSPV